MKKSLFLIITAMISSNAMAVGTAGTCNAVQIDTVTGGPFFGSLIRTDDRSCGNNGWICILPESESRVDEIVSDRVFSMALTARATEDNVRVAWSAEVSACGGNDFPVLTDFRLL